MFLFSTSKASTAPLCRTSSSETVYSLTPPASPLWESSLDTVALPPLEEHLYAFTPRCLLSVPGLVSHTVPLQWELVPSFKPRSYPNSFVKPFLFLPPISSHAHISRGPHILLVVGISSVVSTYALPSQAANLKQCPWQNQTALQWERCGPLVASKSTHPFMLFTELRCIKCLSYISLYCNTLFLDYKTYFNYKFWGPDPCNIHCLIEAILNTFWLNFV